MTRRFAWFDCLRCAAILLVILAHCGDRGKAFPPFWDRVFTDAQLAGWVGVDLFFVLSGFLVSGLLFVEHDQTGALDLKRFLIRRGFKIIPAFYVLLLVTAVVDQFFLGGINVVHLFHDIFFLQSYRMGAWAHAWTLAVEVHFYLLLGFLLYYLSRRPGRDGRWLERLPVILSAVLVLSIFVRLINSAVQHRAFNVHRELQPTHLHLDVLAAGVLLRYFYHYRHDALRFLQRGKLLWIGLGLLLVTPSEYLWMPHSIWLTALMPTSNLVAFSLIVFEATQFPFPASGIAHWLVRPFDYLGKHSYSIYLWHLPVKDWLVDPWVKDRGVIYLLVLFGASLAVGTFFSEVLEMPILHVRNRLFPSTSSALPKTADAGIIVEPPPEERTVVVPPG